MSSQWRVFTLIIQINPNPSVSLGLLYGYGVIGLLLKTEIISTPHLPLLFLLSPILMKLAKVPAGIICKITQFPPTATSSVRVTLVLFLSFLWASIREQ